MFCIMSYEHRRVNEPKRLIFFYSNKEQDFVFISTKQTIFINLKIKSTNYNMYYKHECLNKSV